MGDPHWVSVMDEVSKEAVCRLGACVRQKNCFPEGIHTEAVKVWDRENIQVETFEREAGYTPASEKGGCAAAGAVRRMGLTDPWVWVHMRGGKMRVFIDDAWKVFMTGRVEFIGTMQLSDEFTRKYHIC